MNGIPRDRVSRLSLSLKEYLETLYPSSISFKGLEYKRLSEVVDVLKRRGDLLDGKGAIFYVVPKPVGIHTIILWTGGQFMMSCQR